VALKLHLAPVLVEMRPPDLVIPNKLQIGRMWANQVWLKVVESWGTTSVAMLLGETLGYFVGPEMA
jgi:hypothetical protein